MASLRDTRAGAAGLRFQPGAHGFWRPGLRSAQSQVPDLSHVEELPRLSVQPRKVVKPAVVAAAIIERDGRFLITKRQPGVHLAGYWEFPGGKCHPGETVSHCLARELKEELGVEAVVGREILTTTHDYPDRSVELHFLECKLIGEPTPQMRQEMQWVLGTALGSLAFPPADLEFIQMLARASYTPPHGAT
ncbi:MAG: hypothetical protein C5B57_00845 [Blastocatellia bacterium]|nr:MAG: hypothetical protein C5B57_00845 [Blastocatellia bacterium]